MATVKSSRVVVLAAPRERKMWGKAAKRAAISLAEYMRQAANEKLRVESNLYMKGIANEETAK